MRLADPDGPAGPSLAIVADAGRIARAAGDVLDASRDLVSGTRPQLSTLDIDPEWFGSLSSSSAEALAGQINDVPIELTGVAPIARAISSAGGINFDELGADFMIRRLPGVFAAGEMLDWEAPTGGYLLQACFATGVAAGRGVLKWIKR